MMALRRDRVGLRADWVTLVGRSCGALAVAVVIGVAGLESVQVSMAATPGLVAAYGFDEGSGPTVADASGNGNTGTVSNATWVTTGKFGKALQFNGSSSLATIPDAASLHLTSGMTLEAWVNPTTVDSNWRDVIYKGDDNYYLEATSDRQSRPGGAATFDGARGRVFAPSPLQVGTWTYLAVTYDGATLRLYLDGDEVAEAPQTGSISTSSNPLQIGGDSLYGQYFAGMIDEVRIYNTALTATQIQTDQTTPVNPTTGLDKTPPTAPATLTATAISRGEVDLSWGASTDTVGVTGYLVERCVTASCTFAQIGATGGSTTTSYQDTTVAASTGYSYRVRATDAASNLSPYSPTANATTPAATGPSGLVAAYGFDEGSGSTVTDQSGTGNNGTVANTTWVTTGKYGGALQFNGSSARVNVPDAASLHLTTGMTLEAWVNPTTVNGNWRDVIYKGDDNYYLEATSTNASKPDAGLIAGGSYGDAYGTAALPANSWSYLAETYDGTTLRLYVNGSQVASTAHSGSIGTSTNPLQIGGDSLYGQYFAGMIDEVRIYNTALTATQIQADQATPVSSSSLSAPGNVERQRGERHRGRPLLGCGDRWRTGYQVERCSGAGCSNFAQIGTSSTTTFKDTTVTANNTYSYRVRATDGSGNAGPYSNTASASASTALTISPATAVLTFSRTQQYSVQGPGSGSASWLVDGVAGGTAATGTITSSGLYTPPSAVGSHTISAATGSASAAATVYVTNDPGALTYHNDNLRTGQDLNETVLSPANVKSATFGKLFSYPLDGLALASPLYVQNVNIPGQGFHNIVIVATEHDSVYAFDADGRTSSPLWHVNFTNPAAEVTTVPAADTGETGDIPNEIGITQTPVIDQATGTIYVVAKTKEISGGTTSYVQRLHALDLATGAEKPNSPMVIQGSVPGTGNGSSGGTLSFDPLRENQRTAGLLANGVVYFGFSSHGDNEPFHGWVFGYNASTLQRVMVYCTTPNGDDGGRLDERGRHRHRLDRQPLLDQR